MSNRNPYTLTDNADNISIEINEITAHLLKITHGKQDECFSVDHPLQLNDRFTLTVTPYKYKVSK